MPKDKKRKLNLNVDKMKAFSEAFRNRKEAREESSGKWSKLKKKLKKKDKY